MNLHVFQHADSEGLGTIADWAHARGWTIATTRLHRGESLPDPASVDLLVAMGGPMNIYQDRDHPWLRAERAFIAAHVTGGKPALGVCLGSQFLADALGGRVIQNAQVEIGCFPIDFTGEARERFEFLPASIDVMHWHGDTFDLPVGALRLASSAGCLNQGFLYEDRVLALQFHPELTPESVSDLVQECGGDLQPEKFVQTREGILGTTGTIFPAAHALLHELLDAVFVEESAAT